MSDPSILVTSTLLSETDPNPDSPRLRAVIIVLCVLGVIGIGIIIWWTMRFKVRDRLPFGESTKKTTTPASGVTIAADSSRTPASNSLGRKRSRRESIGEGITNVLRTGSITLKRSLSSTLASTKSKSKSLAAKITPFNQSALDPTKLHDGDGPRFVHTPGLNMRVATRLSNGIWQFSEPMRGGLSSASPFANPSQASLLLNQHPSYPYLSPTSAGTGANPFSDNHASSSVVSLTSPNFSENPFIDNSFTMPRRQGTADSAQSTAYSTDTGTLFTHPHTGTLPPGSIYRGTIYDLERAERGRPQVPTGINDLEEDIMKKKGTPLPVMESELMRRGLRNSIGSVALMSSADGRPRLPRTKSNDTTAALGRELGRRPSAGSAVLLGGTGPVGVSRGRSRTTGAGTYHPDMDDVIDITTNDGREAIDEPSTARREPVQYGDRVKDQQDAREGKVRQRGELDALPIPVSGGIRYGLSPYRESAAFTSAVGHETAPATPHAPSFVNSKRASHIAQPSVGSTLTTATSLYPYDVGVRTAGSIYLGSMTSLGQYATPRPSLGDGPLPSLDRGPAVPPLPSVYSQNHQHPPASWHEFDPDATLLADPTTVYPYSPTSTTFTHSAKKGYEYNGEVESEMHGYGFSDFGRVHKGANTEFGTDDFDAADESMNGHSFEGEDTAAIISAHERKPDTGGRREQRDQEAWKESFDTADLPNIPPPEYVSPKKQQSKSKSGKSRS